MISIVACCHGAKLCAHAARDFRSQHYHQDNCHPKGVVEREKFPYFFDVFICSVMKVNTSLKTDLKMSLNAVENG